MKKRVVSIELLRMLAMMMVVMLHYLDKGDILPALTGEMGADGYVAWGMESLAIVAVNVYMLISGYFLVESGFKPKRLVELICQVLFYTLLVPVVLSVFGVISFEGFTLYNILLNILPVQMNQYWFVTAYVIMYLFSPVLSVAAKTMKQEQLKATIVALLLFFSVSKTILPVELAIDNRGNDCIWFLCVFLVAAYIRLYGIPFFTDKNGFRRGMLVYLAGCAGIYVLMFAVRMVYLKTGSLDHFIAIGLDYNHVLNLLAAVGLFYAFFHLKLPQEGMAAKIICTVAPYSFGVYLFHEQLQIRYIWPQWLGAHRPETLTGGNVVLMVVRSILSVVLVYIVGTLVDVFRGVIFRGAKKVISKFRMIGTYLRYLFPVILCLYPLRHIRVGAEWWDTGYNYANFTYMDRMDEMWLFSTYLGNAVGSLLQKLPFGDYMIGMNLYTGLIVSALALMGYFFFKNVIKLPKWLVFAGEFLAISLCWCPTALLYNYLTYLFMGVSYILLYKALMTEGKKSRIYFVLAGIVLGVNVYTRFSNLAQMALIVAVWAMGIIRREKFVEVVKQTLWCVLGYLLGLGGGFAWIAIRYGADNYVQAILRLLSMPSEASSYTIVSMVIYQIRNYQQNLIWLVYFVLFVIVGMVVYALFPNKIKWIVKIGYVGGYVLLLYYLYNQRMFNMKYSTKMSAFQWAVILLTVTWIAGIVVIFGKKFTEQEKLLCGMNIIMIVITPLGSNNHLYASINNLFLVAPFTLWLIWRFLKWIPKEIPLVKISERWKKAGICRVGTYPIRCLIVCMLVMIFIQSTMFGWNYVFHEGDGGENLHTNIENSDILKGMLTSPDRAEAISTIAAYVNENDLKGKEVILYGQIPAMSYYLEMPFAITAWPYLSSYNYEVMEQDLAQLEEEVARGERELPVILMEIRQGSYLLGGASALEALGVSEKGIEEIAEDPKLILLASLMEKYGYSKSFDNTKFVMFQANTERREE